MTEDELEAKERVAVEMRRTLRETLDYYKSSGKDSMQMVNYLLAHPKMEPAILAAIVVGALNRIRSLEGEI